MCASTVSGGTMSIFMCVGQHCTIIIGHVQQCIYNSSKVHTVQNNLQSNHALHNWQSHVDCGILEVVSMDLVRLCLRHFPAK